MRSFDNAFEDAEQAAWEQHYRWEWEQEQQANEVDDWLASESPEEIWRIWDKVASCSNEWCDLAQQVTIAVLAGKNAKQIANSVMREFFLRNFNEWSKA